MDVTIKTELITMELDTGAAVVISKADYEDRLSKHVKLEKTPLQLHTYMGETIKAVGICTVTLGYDQQVKRLPLHVLEGKRPALFGRGLAERDQMKLAPATYGDQVKPRRNTTG